MKHPLLSVAAALAAVGSACAQITYVDADTATNTTLADGTAYTPAATTSGTDNEWALPSTSMPAPPIQGYNTVHFATSAFLPMQPLAVGATVGFGQSSLGLGYDANGFETDGHFANSVLIQEGNRTMYETVLGQFTADLNGEIDVYVDDLEGPQSTSNRTWYDGVGYELAPLSFGGACGVGTVGLTGVPHRTTNWVVDLVGGDPNSLAVMIVGLSSIPPFDIGAIGFTPGCFLNVTLDLLDVQITDPAGSAGYAGSFAQLPTTGLTPVYFQWATFDAALQVTSTTQALEVNFHY